jgi:iron complex outermembrane receptor protein
MNKYVFELRLTTLFCTLMGVSSGAFPQQDDEYIGQTIEEVIVTAQHREKRLQDVPFSVSAISGEMIEAANMIGIQDLSEVTPSFSFTPSASARGSGVLIRGIGTVNFSDGIEGAVGTVVDGVIIGRQSAALQDFDDIERVEVLRGPQGTLFGKNTSAGLVNVVTRKPTAELEGLIGTSYATVDERRVNGIISGPISDNGDLLGRLSAFSNTRDGLLEQTNPAADVDKMNDKNEWGVRGKLLFNPTDQLSLYLIGEYHKQDADCCVWTERSLSDNSLQTDSLSPFIDASDENRDSAISNVTHQSSDNKGISLQIEHSFDNGSILRAITAAREFYIDEMNDADNTPTELLDRAGTESTTTQHSQEFQWISPDDESFSYMIGGLYFYQKQDAMSRFSGTIVAPVNPDTGPELLLNPEQLATDQNQLTKSVNYAIFGQATYNFAQRWALTVGARRLHDELKIDFERDVEFNSIAGLGTVALPGQLGVATELNTTESDDAYMGMASLQLFYNDDITAYFTVARGYKGTGIAFAADSVDVLDPEIPLNIELGIRANLLAQRVYLAATLFNTKYDDFQTSVDALGGSLTTNIDRVQSQGFELEVSGLITDNLALNMNIAYVDAKVDDFATPVECYPDQTANRGCTEISAGVFAQSLEGNQLPNSPKWSANIGFSYSFLQSKQGVAFTNVNYAWRDEALFSLGGDVKTTQKAYGLLNGRIGYNFTSANIELALWGKNILDKNYAYVIFENFIFSGGYSQFNGMERQIGADAKWRF